MPVRIHLKTSVKSKPSLPVARRTKGTSGIKSIRRRRDGDEETKGVCRRVSDDYGFDVDGYTTRKEKKMRSNPTERYSSKAKRRNFYEDDPRLEQESEEQSRPLRVKAEKDAIFKRKSSVKTDERGTSAEKSPGKVSLKERNGVKQSDTRFSLKKRNEGISADKHKVDSKDGTEKKQASSKEKGNEIIEQKYRKLPSRVLDKSGKKIRVNRKVLEDGSAERPKKKKRTIKIDPYDISNKRLDDSVTHNDQTEEEKNEISKNAQFRAIQPTSEILSFVEDNLIGRRRLIELQNAGYNVKLSAPLDNIPFSTSSDREKIEENVFRNKLEFFAAAKISSSFPPPMVPEIAFAGRSNVGKSSLLNALTRQWGVVRTSDKPGLTQTINFFRLASKLCLVDLPGYGFAYAKEEVKEAWEELVKEYVSTRVGLQRVCLLVDSKWGMKPRDHELIDLMERSQTPYQIVLTKTDTVFPIDVARRAMQIQETLKSNKSLVSPVVMVSSKSGAGIRGLRTVLAKLARFVKP